MQRNSRNLPDFFYSLIDRSKCIYYYSNISGIQGGFAILDVNSHDELNELISTIPITAYGQIDIFPLLHLESAAATMKKLLAQLQKYQDN